MTTLWHLPEDGVGKNPYGQLLTRSLEARGIRVIPVPYRHLFGLRAIEARPDVIHFQFVQPYLLPAEHPDSKWRAVFKGAVFLAQVALLRMAGCRIVWTVHNLVNHERRLARFEWLFTLLFTRLAHHLVVHGQVAREAVIRTYRLRRQAGKITVLFHPNFIGAYPDHLTRDDARERLGIASDSITILSIGQIRAYKGLPDLVRAFRATPARERAELWIAGEPVDSTLAAELAHETQGEARMHLRAAFLSPDEVGMLLTACDIVVLPYRAILTSGAAVLAMSFGKPCVAPRLGCLTEVLDEQGAFLYDASDTRGLRDALDRALESTERFPAMGEHNRGRALTWSWPRAAEILTGLYADAPRAFGATAPAGDA